jgi:hypothetical protein
MDMEKIQFNIELTCCPTAFQTRPNHNKGILLFMEPSYPVPG